MIVGGAFFFMAENKKSFILYCDQKGIWDKLSDDQAGKLIKHVLAYVNDENPTAPDFIIELAFESIKQQLKRDLKKWENQYNQRVLAGKKSAEIRKRNSTAVDESQFSSTVNVNGNVNVTDNVTVNETVINNLVAVSTATIEQRELKFRDSLVPYIETYGKEMLREFFNYWTEKNEGGKKMRFEMQKVFDVKRRLVTWSKNNKFKSNGLAKIISDTAERDELIRAKFAAQKSGSGNTYN